MALTAISPATATASATAITSKPAQPSCSAVEIITAAGTGDANSHDDPGHVYGFGVGVNSAAQLAKISGVSAWQLPYSAPAGVAESVDETRSERVLTYGQSRIAGTKRVLDHIHHLQQRCPETKFILQGLSQGAHIVGDVASQLDPAAVLKVYLLADPARSVLTSDATPSRSGPGASGASGLFNPSGAFEVALDQGRAPINHWWFGRLAAKWTVRETQPIRRPSSAELLPAQ